MNHPEAVQYRRNLAELLRGENDPLERKAALASFRNDPDYIEARNAVISKRGIIIGEKKLAESQRVKTPEELTIEWAYEQLNNYSSLPQRDRREQRAAKRFTQTVATQLLDQPERIQLAGGVWKSQQALAESTQAGFYTQITEAVTIAASENWRNLTHNQLATIVQTDAHKMPILQK